MRFVRRLTWIRIASFGCGSETLAGKRPYFFNYVQNGPKNLGNFRGFLKIILGKFFDFAGFFGDFFNSELVALHTKGHFQELALFELNQKNKSQN